MSSTIVHAARALTPLQEIADAAIVFEDGRITAVETRAGIVAPAGAREISARDATIVPGFVDIHLHGAGGHDVMSSTEEALTTIASTVARHGTTSLVATTVTAPPDETRRSLEGISRCILSPANRTADATAEIIGIHLEGPFILSLIHI